MSTFLASSYLIECFADDFGTLFQVVMDARLIMGVLDSNQGLGTSGTTLLLGPADRNNVFSSAIMNSTANRQKPEFEVQYVVPVNDTFEARHPDHVRGSSNSAFNASNFPAIYSALAKANLRYVWMPASTNIADMSQII